MLTPKLYTQNLNIASFEKFFSKNIFLSLYIFSFKIPGII